MNGKVRIWFMKDVHCCRISVSLHVEKASFIPKGVAAIIPSHNIGIGIHNDMIDNEYGKQVA